MGDTPVLIPNTMVKTLAADDTMLETAWESRWLPNPWGYSSVGRAPALQAGGHEFESRYLHSEVRYLLLNIILRTSGTKFFVLREERVKLRNKVSSLLMAY